MRKLCKILRSFVLLGEAVGDSFCCCCLLTFRHLVVFVLNKVSIGNESNNVNKIQYSV